jgi:hypothetical protein
MFSGLSSLVIEDLADRDGVIVVRGADGGRPGAVPAVRR